jgi:NitT/TauT family transport system ATP-binding protein
MKIHISNLIHSYRGSRSAPLLAIEKVNLEVRKGEFVALIGPSGCGKSTLLRILAGLEEPSSGEVSLDGLTPIQAASKKQVSWMAQKPALLPWRTVQANVALAQSINPQNSRSLMAPDELLDLVKLGDFSSSHPFTLSGGMQQRVALARTLALGASVWLMDEPFTALDELTREGLTREVLRLWKQFRPTVIWVTHSISEAVRMADRVLIMSPRPGQIHTQQSIGLSRPRDETDGAFQDLVRSIRDDLAVRG